MWMWLLSRAVFMYHLHTLLHVTYIRSGKFDAMENFGILCIIWTMACMVHLIANCMIIKLFIRSHWSRQLKVNKRTHFIQKMIEYILSALLPYFYAATFPSSLWGPSCDALDCVSTQTKKKCSKPTLFPNAPWLRQKQKQIVEMHGNNNIYWVSELVIHRS